MAKELEDEVTLFLRYWLNDRRFQPPFEDGIDIHDQLAGSVIFRESQYQVQLLIIKPHAIIPAHVHPNVDSYEIFITGDIEFSKNGKIVETGELDEFPGHHIIRVKPTDWHGARFGEQGGCFLSVQYWQNHVKPTSVGHDWRQAGPSPSQCFAELPDLLTEHLRVEEPELAETE